MVEQLGQLDRNLKSFGTNLQVRYYPYGRTTLEGGKYNCTLGQTQCVGNKIHVRFTTFLFIFFSQNNYILQACSIGEIMYRSDDDFPHDNYDPYQGELTSSIACFFKNRFNQEDAQVLATSCGMKPEKSCLKEYLDYKEVTAFMAAKSNGVDLTTGFFVQFEGQQIKSLETNLVGEICNKLGVSLY